MRRQLAAVLVLALIAGSVTAQPKRKTAPEIRGKPGDLLVIKAESTGKATFFFDARDFGPTKSYQQDKLLILTTLKPGTYSVNVVLWAEQSVEQTLIIVEGAVPPDPGPVPPDPDPSPAVSLGVEPPTGQTGKAVTVTYTKSRPGDWIGLYDQSDTLVDWRRCEFSDSYALFPINKAGKYSIRLYGQNGKKLAAGWYVATGSPAPDPPKPDPPKPSTPILGDGGMRVLFIVETMDGIGKVPVAMRSAIFGAEVRDILNTKTKPTPDGGKRGWYIIDKDEDFSAESRVWGDALKRPRTTLPWVIISSPVGNYEGPVPDNVAAMVALLKKYAE